MPVLLTEQDIYHFREGTHVRAYDKLGAHLVRGEQGDVQGTHFAVWAPNAREVSVVGDFNGWDPTRNRMHPRLDSSGIWETFVADVQHGTLYKYHIVSKNAGYTVKKADPYAFRAEQPPRTASVVWDLSYEWGDSEWVGNRARANGLDAPWCIYELHIGSWRRVPEEHGRPLTYRELAHAVADYVTEMGFTHVELMPVMEHPFYGSWGYQITGFYAPSSRYGSPQDFMYFVDHLHRRGIGVILDWVPSHFPTDEHGLSYFDGTHLYEHADPRKGFHPEWNSSIFNYGRSEVRNFLASNAVFWLDVYHADALRVDAVASMLYLDYGRKSGEWIPNIYGGHENLEAVEFLKQLNLAVYRDAPYAQTIAEESTAWPMVSRPTYVGGLGFGLKWNMGWMHDTLKYFQNNPVHRKYVHNQLTFSLWYAFTENFVLALSHDEVVHGKGALIGKMPGDEWQQFANLRLLLAYMWMHPGKKLLFMGGEIGQKREWHHEESLEWHVLDYPLHAGVQRLVRDLNKVVRGNAALYQIDFSSDGFQWVDANNSDDSVLVFLRKGRNGEAVLVAANFTPVPRREYRIGAPVPGTWHEVLNSDAADYGGSGLGNFGAVEAVPHPSHGQPCSLTLQLPPLALVVLAPASGQQPGVSSGSAASAAPAESALSGPQAQGALPIAQLGQQTAPPPLSSSLRGSAQPRSPRTVFTTVATPWLATTPVPVAPPSSVPAPSTALSAASSEPPVSANAVPPEGTLLPEPITPPELSAAPPALALAEPAGEPPAHSADPETSVIIAAAANAAPLHEASPTAATEIPQSAASIVELTGAEVAEPAPAAPAVAGLPAQSPAPEAAAALATPPPDSLAPLPVGEVPPVGSAEPAPVSAAAESPTPERTTSSDSGVTVAPAFATLPPESLAPGPVGEIAPVSAEPAAVSAAADSPTPERTTSESGVTVAAASATPPPESLAPAPVGESPAATAEPAVVSAASDEPPPSPPAQSPVDATLADSAAPGAAIPPVGSADAALAPLAPSTHSPTRAPDDAPPPDSPAPGFA